MLTDLPTPDLSKLDPVLFEHAPGGRSRLLPALLEAQQIYGHVPAPVAEAIGRALRVPLAEIHGVLDFYSMLSSRPTGRRVVRVCTSPLCSRVGGEEALVTAARRLGLHPGEPSADGEWMIEEAPCLGLCDFAPAALIGEEATGPIDPSQPELLAGPRRACWAGCDFGGTALADRPLRAAIADGPAGPPGEPGLCGVAAGGNRADTCPGDRGDQGLGIGGPRRGRVPDGFEVGNGGCRRRAGEIRRVQCR